MKQSGGRTNRTGSCRHEMSCGNREGPSPHSPLPVTSTKLMDYFAGITVFAEFALSKRSYARTTTTCSCITASPESGKVKS